MGCADIKDTKISWLTWNLWDIYEICIMVGFNAWIYRGGASTSRRHLAAHPSLLVTHRTSPAMYCSTVQKTVHCTELYKSLKYCTLPTKSIHNIDTEDWQVLHLYFIEGIDCSEVGLKKKKLSWPSSTGTYLGMEHSKAVNSMQSMQSMQCAVCSMQNVLCRSARLWSQSVRRSATGRVRGRLHCSLVDSAYLPLGVQWFNAIHHTPILIEIEASISIIHVCVEDMMGWRAVEEVGRRKKRGRRRRIVVEKVDWGFSGIVLKIEKRVISKRRRRKVNEYWFCLVGLVHL